MKDSSKPDFVPPEGGALKERGVVWVITLDKIWSGDPGDAPATGTAGPHQATTEEVKRAAKFGRIFRMLDDDGNDYYHGRTLTLEGPGSELDFVPLWEFGTPDSGCTEIQYKNASDEWVTL